MQACTAAVKQAHYEEKTKAGQEKAAVLFGFFKDKVFFLLHSLH
jgi:hypothetical protein